MITFSTGGKKEFVFTVTFSDNSTEIVKTTIDVVISNNAAISKALAPRAPSYDPIGNFVITAIDVENTIPFQGYNETIATKGILEYRTYYNPATNPEGAVKKIKKEVIILDGFDPGDGRKIDGLYDLMYYDPDNNSDTKNNENLVEKLRNDYGYDVTLVNFQNGADFIERNAMALIALLKRENAKLIANGSNEKITIIGPSMGGLISRYALAYMEKNGINHNTKLWVSFDSPHLGANIPVSTQSNLYFYGFIGGVEKAKSKYIENFWSPAARQMLIEQLDAYPLSQTFSTTLGMNNNAPFRKQFMQNLGNNGLPNSNGFPQNLRKIAISNGTTNTLKTNIEKDCILEMAAFKKVLVGNIKVATLVDYNLPLPSNSYISFEGKYTIPGTLSLTVIDVTKNITNYNLRGSMDVVQGGTFNTQGIIKDEFTPVLNNDVSFHEWRQYKPNHSFIPTVSALSFKYSNFDWNLNLNRNLICTKEIPFDSYFVAKTNESHVFVSSDLVNWLIKEITGNPQALNLNLSDIKINTTKKVICMNEIISLGASTDDLCLLPSAYNWTTSNNLQIVTNTGKNIQIKALQDGLGYVYMNFSNGQKITQKIWIGKPKFNLVPDKNNTNYVIFNAESTDANATLEDQGLIPSKFTWKRLDTGQIKTGFSYFANGSSYNWHFDVKVDGQNSCGTYTNYTTITPPPPPSCGNVTYKTLKINTNEYKIARIIIDPCPQSKVSKTMLNDEIYKINIENKLKTISLFNEGSTFNLDDLPSGDYNIKIYKDNLLIFNDVLHKE